MDYQAESVGHPTSAFSAQLGGLIGTYIPELKNRELGFETVRPADYIQSELSAPPRDLLH
jgi:hypothetical protein